MSTRAKLTYLAAVCLFLTAIIAPPVDAAPASHRPKTISIAEARRLPLGTTVTVEGTVITPSGDFVSSYFDEGFAIQDRTAGIFVSMQTDIGVDPPRRVRVTGVLTDSSGLLVVVPAGPSDVNQRGGGKPVQPLWVRTGSVDEATEGLLVQVVGVITQGPIDDMPFGHKFFIDDGSGAVTVYVNVPTGIDLTGFAAGQLVSVVGFSSQFTDHYEVDVRSQADLRRPAP
ncbi:MAG: hypothetical protein HY828_11950 [Actinobacteria bacterium]|nr:hypothetical protein [Actinomycetota bacterium]